MAAAKRKTVRYRSNAAVPPAKAFTSHAPQIASTVFPVAIPNEVKRLPKVVTLTKNAPTNMAGQSRQPNTRSAARAIPVGGQTGDALACRKARFKLSFPAKK